MSFVLPFILMRGLRISSNSFGRTVSMFSTRRYLPYRMAYSNSEASFSSLCFNTINISFLVLIPNFLMKLFAWPCGSIHRGYFLVFSMINPFSIEISSAGSLYCAFQFSMTTSSPIMLLSVVFLLRFILRSFNPKTQISWSFFLYIVSYGLA